MLSAAILMVTGCGRSAVKVWTSDPLTKVFRDERITVSDEAVAEVARGETASLQIVVCGDWKIEKLKATLESLALQNDKNVKLDDIKVRFVGYVHVGCPIEKAPSDQLRKPPADFPDFLLEDKTIDVQAKANQPIWITIAVPTTAKAGVYSGDMKITGLMNGKAQMIEVPVSVRVYDVVVGKSRLWLTNWFYMSKCRTNPSTNANLADLEQYSPVYWELLRKYARDMAEHRQNVARLSALELTEYSVGKSGRLRFDFARFDKAVEIFIDEGVIGRIEGSHLGGRIEDKWENQFEAYIYKIKDGNFVKVGCDPCSAEAEEFYSQFLPALTEHLQQKNWLEIYMQHIADEPTNENVRSYVAIAKLVRKYAPRFKIIEACHTKELAGFVDIWVPQMNFLKDDYLYYKQRQAASEEVWFYTCMYPQGEYANRFIEQPLWKTRILHWINYYYGLTGYLHWGYNFWSGNPFKETAIKDSGLPGGDAWVVYPGVDGPLDSIRFETMRDGVADYELLCMLRENDPAAAMILVSKHIQGIDKYNCDVKSFRQTRRELLEILSKKRKN
jgi:hypothetical protein